jgi:hypothetical protein
MKKSKATAFFLIVLSYGAFLSMKGPVHRLVFANTRNESIFIRCEAYPELQVVMGGKIYYTLKYKNEEIGYLHAGSVGYDYIYEIKPNDGLDCYGIDPYMLYETGPNVQFLNLTPLEQLRVIYTSLSVKDKDGNEILNLETIRPDDFVTNADIKEWKYLIIK